mmetsp:Transcript_1989/g.6357  ORF Transcript_1989/g.6357 Transcript_1989/m.6357 type:complete len:233 (-) Transcript_1989:390-1088(-)
MLSSSSRRCASRNSRRSFESALCVIAARCREPSGFFTTLIGDSSRVRRVWPARNGGSSSRSSTSISSASSATCTMPMSSSKVGYSSTGSTPLLISCCASQRSGDDMRLATRKVSPAARPPPAPAPAPPAAPAASLDGFDRGACRCLPRIGRMSAPVSWSTSRMLTDILVAVTLMTLTLTRWPFSTASFAVTSRCPAFFVMSVTWHSPSRPNRGNRTNAPKSITLVISPSWIE